MKEYTIRISRKGTARLATGSLEYLTNYFAYTLSVGKSYEAEKGNKKINTAPKTVKSLVSNLNKASDNSGSSTYYVLEG